MYRFFFDFTKRPTKIRLIIVLNTSISLFSNPWEIKQYSDLLDRFKASPVIVMQQQAQNLERYLEILVCKILQKKKLNL